MYSQFSISASVVAGARQTRFQRLLVAGNWGMMLGVILTLLSVVASYGLSQYLSMAAQIVAHISTLLFATLVKFGYIARCIALNGFNKERKS